MHNCTAVLGNGLPVYLSQNETLVLLVLYAEELKTHLPSKKPHTDVYSSFAQRPEARELPSMDKQTAHQDNGNSVRKEMLMEEP